MPDLTTRSHIVEAADDLFYRRGFGHTSFAAIAKQVEISRGNFYHHFKSKDEILDAVIESRSRKTEAMLRCWEDESGDPVERIRSFINILLNNGDQIKLHGCPVGTLTGELAKLKHASRDSAGHVFELFRRWLRHQFAEAGCRKNADELALHVLARSQGVAVLYNATGNDRFLKREVRMLMEWIDSVTPGSARPGRPRKAFSPA